jgi:uncharacterized protein YjeT (DUF2065 family)
VALGSLARSFTAGLRGALRPGRPPLPRGATELRLLEALDLEGCPICRVIEGADERHLFWFLHENFTKSGYPEAWTGSLGFCSGHGEALLRREGVRLRMATTHRALLRRRRALWRQEAGGRATPAGGGAASCPACAAHGQAAREAANTLLILLERPDMARRYGAGGALCLPHLRLLAPGCARNLLEQVLEVEERALAKAAARPEVTAMLRLTAGSEPTIQPVPHPPEDGAPAPRLPDPAETILRDLAGVMACPICLELRRTWLEWLEQLPDGLPACPGHFWSAARMARPEAARRMAERSLEMARASVQVARAAIPDGPGLLRRTAQMWKATASETGAAPDDQLRAGVCAPCRQLERARDAALLHLFGLLERSEGREVFERGYGLCARHAAAALALRPPQPVRAFLWKVEDARLETLEREVAEYARKSNWHARDEPMGAEASAPERAVRRFSGFLCAPLPVSTGKASPT